MEIKEILNYVFGGLIAALGFFLKKTLSDMEDIKVKVVEVEKRIEVNEQKDRATKELIEQKLDNHKALIEQKFEYLTTLIEKRL